MNYSLVNPTIVWWDFLLIRKNLFYNVSINFLLKDKAVISLGKKIPSLIEGNSFIRRGQIRLLFAGYTPVGFFIGLDFSFSSYWIFNWFSGLLDLVFLDFGLSFSEFGFEFGFSDYWMMFPREKLTFPSTFNLCFKN